MLSVPDETRFGIAVEKRISAFVQIVGTLEPTRLPVSQPELRRWFIEVKTSSIIA